MIVSRDTENILVVVVESEISDEFLVTALLLQVCVCAPTKGSICSKIMLKEIMLSVAKAISFSFIKGGFRP